MFGIFHVSQFLALCTAHKESQFKARTANSSVSNKTYFAGSVLMLGTQRALITIKYWVFSTRIGSFLKFLILIPAGITETKQREKYGESWNHSTSMSQFKKIM